MKMKEYTFFIDVHEDKKIIKVFDKEKINYEVRSLKVGDYNVVGGDEKVSTICFERKSFDDFVGSVYSGRLFEQLMNMQKNFDYNYLFVVGYFEDFVKGCIYSKRKAPTVEWYLGTIASILVRYDVKVFAVKNNRQMVRLMKKIVEKIDDGRGVEFVKRIALTTDDRVLNVLCCVEGISVEKAKRVLEKFSLYDLFLVEVDDLIKVPGIGRKLAENIKKVFRK